ncbi:hypothetical protein DOK_12046 [gamma proteobacterium BDW918]|nr:hypothetical protein DOK_12046 [gamma proteobacterium BDW918]
MEINTSLSPSQAHFALWLEEHLPELLTLFDFQEKVYREDVVERYLSTASHGQTIMAQFALGVWLHRNEFEFNFFDAASILDDRYKAIIASWFSDPFWP